MSQSVATSPRRAWSGPAGFDKVGVLIFLIAAAALTFFPFMRFAENRIAAGEPRTLIGALPELQGAVMAALLAAALLVVLFRTPVRLRLLTGLGIISALGITAGLAANELLPDDQPYARVSPGGGFWLLLFAFALVVADALARLKLRPAVRILLVLASIGAIVLFLASGIWSNLSILKEYASRSPAFWSEAEQHMLLAFGSLFLACLIGIPLGISCRPLPRVRSVVLNTLNIVQTIPSIALFGLLIAPLGWLATNVPLISTLPVSGIGTAPALVALFAYSLLPVVANTVVGLDSVPASANEAARGMGMTDAQRLMRVELPLAFPAILTGIRIVLVQNIGLATIAALIGGGGFGVFVFQGIGQMAMDLVLLGALPTIILAFAAAAILDALVDMSRRTEKLDI